ncbi:hypothetical protein DD587_32105 [Klebsiella pneumoniae]|nr:hypothetical protein DD587_32105 [Klebsiella pneumoniae]
MSKILRLSNIHPPFCAPTGKKIDGIWHTAIVVYGREYFFGSHGISSCNPVRTPFFCNCYAS